MTSVCKFHSRPERSKCERCGQPRCDWCEKLAPSWGPGYCEECLHFVTPEGAGLRGRWGLGLLVLFLLALSGFGFFGLHLQLGRTPVNSAGVTWTAVAAIGPLIAAVFAVAMRFRR